MNTARNKHNVQDENNVKDYSNGASVQSLVFMCSLRLCVCVLVSKVSQLHVYLLQQTFSHLEWSISQSIY